MKKRYLTGRLRAAVRRRPAPRVAIIGAGFGGLAAAVALRRIGVDDLVIIERCDGVGGTWRLNTYPGAACDIQSHLYSFSFAPNRNWSRTYARQPEILAYLESVAQDFDLNRHLLTNTAVRSIRWNAGTTEWDLGLESVTTGGASAYSADVVVSAVGLFGEPKLPEIDGLTDFGGSIMHTSRWDRSADLTDRRVAVVGTGASAVQVVPEIVEIAAEVTIFQRTPPWMVPKDDRAFTGDELDRFRRSRWAARRERWRLWKEQHDNTALRVDDPLVAGRQGIAAEFLHRTVADDSLRAALTPDYPFRCKRVLLGSDYYTALQQDNVVLVTEPIDKVTETGVCTAQSVTDVDVIVLATGFQTNHYLAGIEVTGVDGQSLHQRWGEDPSAYLGVAVSGFPNFLMLYGPNTNQGGNSIVYILEAGARLVADGVGRLARKGGTLEVRPEAERRFNEEISAELEHTVWTQCGSYFRSPTGRIVTQWPYNELEYARRTRRVRPRDWIHRPGGQSPSGQDPMTLPSSRRARS
ncbi:flavin-containing monooxygenase [Mycolicibacterium helvum]|uniref:Monooxygenase n=1 Tax=Mycolicibacterium helvum TaxID=1534349 RepID=A0A7I7T732_9MYCO|nr:NAD(P)/FAD-dependent oxidoreductase [Mycolicibacterium helvum]BBY65072.1 monooxygenase [Mycolicibacterium helvum]